MELRISLFRHLEKLIEVLGVPANEVVSKESIPGETKFVICMDLSKIPHSTLSGVTRVQHFFTGNHPHNSTIAEHKAVMSAKKFLEDTFIFKINDLSHSKIVSLELKIAHVLSIIKAFTNRLHSFMKEYQSSINLLGPFPSFACQNVTDVFNGISKSFSDLCKHSQSSIDRIKEQLLGIDLEMNLYYSGSSPSTSANTDKQAPLVFKIDEEFLADILQLLQLPPAQYSSDLIEEDVFNGSCSVYLGSLSCTNLSEQINIRGENKPLVSFSAI